MKIWPPAFESVVYSEMGFLRISECGVFCEQNQVPVPEGGLTPELLHPRVIGHQGVPATASILGFEPTQRVLAVASLYVNLHIFSRGNFSEVYVGRLCKNRTELKWSIAISFPPRRNHMVAI